MSRFCRRIRYSSRSSGPSNDSRMTSSASGGCTGPAASAAPAGPGPSPAAFPAAGAGRGMPDAPLRARCCRSSVALSVRCGSHRAGPLRAGMVRNVRGSDRTRAPPGGNPGAPPRAHRPCSPRCWWGRARSPRHPASHRPSATSARLPFGLVAGRMFVIRQHQAGRQQRLSHRFQQGPGDHVVGQAYADVAALAAAAVLDALGQVCGGRKDESAGSGVSDRRSRKAGSSSRARRPASLNWRQSKVKGWRLSSSRRRKTRSSASFPFRVQTNE